jgi:hypothetical protein
MHIVVVRTEELVNTGRVHEVFGGPQQSDVRYYPNGYGYLDKDIGYRRSVSTVVPYIHFVFSLLRCPNFLQLERNDILC